MGFYHFGFFEFEVKNGEKKLGQGWTPDIYARIPYMLRFNLLLLGKKLRFDNINTALCYILCHFSEVRQIILLFHVMQAVVSRKAPGAVGVKTIEDADRTKELECVKRLRWLF